MTKFLPNFLFFIVYSFYANAQTPVGAVIGNQKVVEVAIAPAGYAKAKALQWLPDDYQNTAKRYPLMIFLHNAGAGQSNDVSAVLGTSLPQLISQGLKPYGIDPQTGDTLKYVVVSPHAAGTYWSYSYGHLKYLIPFLRDNLRIDPTRIYICGISAGGWGVWSLPSEDVNYVKANVAAIVPISAVDYNAGKDENIKSCVRNNLGIWQICGAQDAHVNTARRYDRVIKSALTNPNNYGYIEVPGADHNEAAWNPPFYQNSTAFKGKNLWSKLLEYKVGGTQTPPANQPPTANAGADQTISLPATSVMLNGTGRDDDGSIASYRWSKTSGGQATITSPNSASTTVTGLAAGTYIFRLTVTDNQGATAYDEVTVIVKAADNPPPVQSTIRIQAESYTAMRGIQTENTQDAGGGLNVGWINNGDYMDYSVNIPAAGLYTAKFRIATAEHGGEFQLRKQDGSVLATITVTNTGSFQNWHTISSPVNLSAGTQTLRLVSTKNPGWNINWFEFKSGRELASLPGKLEAESYSAMRGIQTEYCHDAGNGLNVGWIDNGDWLEYDVQVENAGSYQLHVRVASSVSNGRCAIQNESGATLATVNIPATGGYQSWRTVSTTISLNAGPQKLKLVSVNSPIWNVNWIEVVETGNARMSAGAQSSAGGDTALIPENVAIHVYPNPVKDMFNLQINNGLKEAVKVRVIDFNGATRQEFDVSNKTGNTVTPLVLKRGLPAGTYIVQIVTGTAVKSFKIVKL